MILRTVAPVLVSMRSTVPQDADPYRVPGTGRDPDRAVISLSLQPLARPDDRQGPRIDLVQQQAGIPAPGQDSLGNPQVPGCQGEAGDGEYRALATAPVARPVRCSRYGHLIKPLLETRA